MSNPDTCPFCGSAQLFPGSISSEGYVFRPLQARVPLLQLVLTDGIDFGPDAHLCANCGVLWANADRQKARAFIETYGSETAIAILNDITSRGTSKSATPPAPAAT